MADTCPPISPALGDHRYYNDLRPASDSTTGSPQQPEQTSHFPLVTQSDNNEPEQGDQMIIDSSDDGARQPPSTEAEGDDGDSSESDAAKEDSEDDDDDDMDDNAGDNDEGLNRVVAAEIEAVKEIERGPSEATLRRMKLIELDPDEAEEKIERFKRLGTEAISKATGLSRADRIAKLRNSRRFLAPLWKGKQSLDLIETYLEKQLGRLFGDEEPPFDPVAYLEQDAFSDEEEEAAAQAAAQAAAAAENEQNMIALSDSEDEDEAEDEGDAAGAAPSALPSTTTTPAPAPAAAAVQSPIARGGFLPHLKSLGFPAAGAAADAQRKLFLAPMRVAPSSRAALMISLRRQVQRTATENYCAQRRIRQDELQQQLAIADHCRALVELLRDHYLEKEQRIVEERQARYAQMADDEDDAEFGDAGLADGQFLTDEERRRLYQRLRRRGDSDGSDDDYDDGDEDEDGDGDDDDADGDGDSDADAMDADDAAEEANEAVAEELFVDEELAAHDPKPELAAADDDEAPVVRKSSHRPQRASLLDEDDDDAVDERRDAAVPATAAAAAAAPSDAADDAQSLADSTHDEDAAGAGAVALDDAAGDGGAAEDGDAAAASREPRPKKERTGNALYRMMLEDDERRFRNQKRSALIDDEAEEEEEEGGIGDFGFGDLANVRDAEDERNAGRLQKGDLDHIVDDVSDGEGDEAAERAAVYQMELQEDRARTKLIVEAITEGHEAFRQRKHRRKQGYSFETLVTGRKASDAAGDAAAEPNDAEEELDFEEMLQRGLSEKMEREKRRRYNDEDEDEDEDDAAFGDEDDGPGAFAGDLFDEDGQPLFAEGFVGADGEIWTREMIAAEQERIQRDRDARRAEYLRRKQMDKDFKMRRELRYLQLQRAQSLTRQTSTSSLSQAQAPSSGLAPPSLSSLLPASLPANARVNPAILQRLAPHAATTTTSFAAAAAAPVAAHTLQKRLKRAATVAPASASSSGGATPRGLFQLVTGAAPAASGAAGPAPMLHLLSKKRSFSALLHDGASQLGSRSQPPGGGGKRLARTHSIL